MRGHHHCAGSALWLPAGGIRFATLETPMMEIALRTLVHDRGKFIAALAGVAFAATLVVVQIGLYLGFLEASSVLVRRAGGDVWVMARGTEAFDAGEPLAAGTRASVAGQSCVQRVRAMIFGVSVVRTPRGARESVQVAALEQTTDHLFPWTLVSGLPDDLNAPHRVAIDGFDVHRLELPVHPVGARFDLAGRVAQVAVLSAGIRSFTLQPFIFAGATFARRVLGMDRGEATFWIADLARPACAAAVIAAVEKNRGLKAMASEAFRKKTEDYWVAGSGAGTALAFGALLGLFVGAVIVGQTLYSLTKDHLRELGTLKAMGASGQELIGFVLWQALVLALLGGGLGLAMSLVLERAVAAIGLVIVVTPPVLAAGLAIVIAMCGLASTGGVRRVLAIDPSEVFQ